VYHIQGIKNKKGDHFLLSFCLIHLPTRQLKPQWLPPIYLYRYFFSLHDMQVEAVLLVISLQLGGGGANNNDSK
jgi:hypothetical protein